MNPRRRRAAHAPDGSLSAGDLERLQKVCRRRRLDPTRSLFGPDTVTWRVNREATLLLGGGRALLMQVAHPLVAAGVAAHSGFRRRPLQRLWRTLDLMLTIVFADAASALRAVQAIERVHARVRGVLAAEAGIFPRGTRYDANDPHLQLWVHATLLDSALLVYERFVRPLPPAQRRAFYDESKMTARLFGIPERLIPRTLGDFHDYVREMTEGETLAVSRAGREIAASILNPPLPPPLKQAFQVTNLFTVGLLPPALRERYRLPWGRGRQALLDSFRLATSTFLPVVPGVLRALPLARRAFR